MNRLAISIIGLLCCCSGHAEPASIESEAGSHSLVTALSGDLPIILSAPHGGRETIPGVSPRQGKGVRDFQTKTDSETARLTEELADAIASISGKRPYIVIARFHRKFIDANRAPKSAYESDLAKPVYDAYQHALAEARQKIIDRWGSGILLDIHGQSLGPDTIFRGTQQGKATTHLTRRFGKEALIGGKSLFGQLASQGFTVDPPVASPDKEAHYSGGHIVATYGSAAGGAFDAIQLELGKNLRSAAQRTQTAGKMANAIIAYANDYLPREETIKGGQAVPRMPGQVIVGVYHDEGTGTSVNGLTRTLAKFDNLKIRMLMADDIKSGKLKEVDVLIQPGGSGGGQGRLLGEDGRERIREFVRNGGGYVGICAGAYLATADYTWSLNILDAKVVDREHWARGKGTVGIELSDLGKQMLRSPNADLKIHYAQGPLLAPANKPDIPDYQTLATFKTEIALNGAPKGVMPGTTAAAHGRFGNGHVICFSPHPELTAGLEDLLRHAIGSVNQGSSTTPIIP